MRADAASLYEFLQGGLKDDHLAAWAEGDGGRYALLQFLSRSPGILDNLRFKAKLVDEFLGGCRSALTESLGREAELLPNAFPPPFSTFSGMHFGMAARHSNGISVKLYTMHWPMIARFYADDLKKWNPGLSEQKLAQSIVRLLDIADQRKFNRIADLTYPEPDVPHPVGIEHQIRKIRQAQSEAGSTPVFALAHGYGPLDDFRSRLQAAFTASQGRVWINRYGYLSDEKLSVIKSI
jgi:hypothetical protein